MEEQVALYEGKKRPFLGNNCCVVPSEGRQVILQREPMWTPILAHQKAIEYGAAGQDVAWDDAENDFMGCGHCTAIVTATTNLYERIS